MFRSTCKNNLFKNPGRTSKGTPHFTIKKINWITLFKEIIDVYIAYHTKPIKNHLRIQSVRQREHHTSPLQRSTG
jgi:hypothetical protein